MGVDASVAREASWFLVESCAVFGPITVDESVWALWFEVTGPVASSKSSSTIALLQKRIVILRLILGLMRSFQQSTACAT